MAWPDLAVQRLVVAKFGGSAIGPDGLSIPIILQRIEDLKRDAKVVAVFSAPLTICDGRPCSLTDVMLRSGRIAASGGKPEMEAVYEAYGKILELVGGEYEAECRSMVSSCLEKAKEALLDARERREFVDEVRSRALAYSGELLMSHVMAYIIRGRGVSSEAVDLDDWPIATDNNIEFTNFLRTQSAQKAGKLEQLVAANEVVSIGGFIGKTVDGTITTYERGGSDRTAANIGILLHKKYETVIDFEKDGMVVSADPKVISEGLSEVASLSYNEARLAGMFGMKILDPIAIKEILENGIEIPIAITSMNDPSRKTTIERRPENRNAHPLKIVTGKRNCAILRMEREASQRLQKSLKHDKRYSEYVVLSPFTKDEIEFSRLLFLDADYLRRNERYVLGFDSLATIAYDRGVITLIGDEMWRIPHIASRASAKVGEAGINILNMDAQEETSRIIIVVEDSDGNVATAIRSIHSERDTIRFA